MDRVYTENYQKHNILIKNLFGWIILNVDYKKIYSKFIEDRRLKESALSHSGEYFERHHIIPKSLGGDDSEQNLIILSAGDHFFAHLLLAKAYGGNMWFAANMMINQTKGMLRNYGKARHVYSMIRKNHAAAKSELYIGERNPNYGKQWTQEQKNEAKRKSRAAWARGRGKYIAAFRKRAPVSDETKKKLSEIKLKNSHKNPMKRPEVKALFMGENSPMRRPEVIAKFKGGNNSKAQKVICLETSKVFESIIDAAEWANVKDRYSISHCCAGRRKSCGGYKWAYA